MAHWHLITGEYPPQPGGVSDYTLGLACGLAASGDDVHVWCPPHAARTPPVDGVMVNREFGFESEADLRGLGERLDGFPGPRRLLVQWVPHSFGRRSLNVPFCVWLWRRSRLHGDQVEIMVHEPYLGFQRGAWRQNAAAAVHRLMTLILLRAARRVWVSTPAWERRWRKYAPRRLPAFQWIPIPSAIPVVDDPAAVARVRERFAPRGERILGHFSTYRGAVSPLLAGLAAPALVASEDRVLLLMGRGGEAFRTDLLRRHPSLAGRVHATGGLPAAELSVHLLACDLLVQPYPDGANGRQSSLAAALAHGRPALTTEGENTEPVWRESGAVALARVGDVGAALSRIEELLGDVSARARLGRAAAALYRSHFEMERIVTLLREAP